MKTSKPKVDCRMIKLRSNDMMPINKQTQKEEKKQTLKKGKVWVEKVNLKINNKTLTKFYCDELKQ